MCYTNDYEQLETIKIMKKDLITILIFGTLLLIYYGGLLLIKVIAELITSYIMEVQTMNDNINLKAILKISPECFYNYLQNVKEQKLSMEQLKNRLNNNRLNAIHRAVYYYLVKGERKVKRNV